MILMMMMISQFGHSVINNMAFLIKDRISIRQGTTQDRLRSDDKRPDGFTVIPWRGGRCATCDITVTASCVIILCSKSSGQT